MPSVSFTARVTIPDARPSTPTTEANLDPETEVGGVQLNNQQFQLQAVIMGHVIPLTYIVLDDGYDDDNRSDGSDGSDSNATLDDEDNNDNIKNNDAPAVPGANRHHANGTVGGDLANPTQAAVNFALLTLQASVAELFRHQVGLREEVGLLWDEVNDHRRCTKPITDAYQRQQHKHMMRQADLSFDRYVAGQRVQGPAAAAAEAMSPRGWGHGTAGRVARGVGVGGGAARTYPRSGVLRSGVAGGVKIQTPVQQQRVLPSSSSSRKRPCPDSRKASREDE